MLLCEIETIELRLELCVLSKSWGAICFKTLCKIGCILGTSKYLSIRFSLMNKEYYTNN